MDLNNPIIGFIAQIPDKGVQNRNMFIDHHSILVPGLVKFVCTRSAFMQ